MQLSEKSRGVASQRSRFWYLGPCLAFAGSALAPLPAAAQSGGQAAASFAGVLGLLLLLGLLVVGILYLVSLYKALAACSPANRSLPPGLVWLNVIPLFSSVWIFVTIVSVASSLRREHVDRSIASDSGHGLGAGLVFAISGLLANIAAVSTQLLGAGLGVLYPVFALIALVFWIVHWSGVVRSRHEIERGTGRPGTAAAPARHSDAGSGGSAHASGPGEPPGGAAPMPRPGRPMSPGKVVGIVFGVLGLAVVFGGGLLVVSLLANSGGRLKAVSLETDGIFVPDVVAVLHNTGRGGYFNFFVEAGGKRICNGGKTFIAKDERRKIRFSCPRLSDHTEFELRWKSDGS